MYKLSNTKKLAISSVLVSLSVVLSAFGNNTLPFFSFFKLDFSDIPIFIIALIFGKFYGILSILSVSIIRMFTGDVPIPEVFAMRMSSLIPLIFLDNYRRTRKYFLISCIIAIILLVMVRIPLSYSLWVQHYKISKHIFIHDMQPSITILLIIRTFINLIIAKLLATKLERHIMSTIV